MNWDAIGAVAESLGAIGVIITLIYLSNQIRNNTRQMRSQAIVSLREAHSRLLAELRADPDLLELLLKGNVDWHALSPQEQSRYHLWNVEETQLVETAFILWRQDAIAESLYAEKERYFLTLLRMPGRLHWWKHYVYSTDAEFKARLDEKLLGVEVIDDGDFLEQFPMYRRAPDDPGAAPPAGS